MLDRPGSKQDPIVRSASVVSRCPEPFIEGFLGPVPRILVVHPGPHRHTRKTRSSVLQTENISRASTYIQSLLDLEASTTLEHASCTLRTVAAAASYNPPRPHQCNIKAPQQGWRPEGTRCWPKGCSRYASLWKRRAPMRSSDAPSCHPQARHHLGNALLPPCSGSVAARLKHQKTSSVGPGTQDQCPRLHRPRSYAPARPVQQTAQTGKLDPHAIRPASQGTHQNLSCQYLDCC